MTDGVPDVMPMIGGLIGIGIMAGVANQLVRNVGEQTREREQEPKQKSKKKKNANYVPNPFGNASFSSTMDERIKRML
jgi:hypothetical protein